MVVRINGGSVPAWDVWPYGDYETQQQRQLTGLLAGGGGAGAPYSFPTPVPGSPVPATPTPTPTPVPATPTPTPTPAPTVPPPPVVVTPNPPPLGTPMPFTMPASNANVAVPTAPVMPAAPTLPDRPVLEDASVANQLTGLLASDSPYMRLAREAGRRGAARRGLLNSSIAEGSSEAAAIAAGAPIASQDAAQIHARNQANLEGWTQLRNATTLQGMQDAAAAWRQLSGERNAIMLNNSSNTAALERLISQGNIEQAIALIREDGALNQTQINANVALLGNYMQAYAALAANKDIPAATRNAYMAEFLRVTTQGQNLVNALSGTTVTWNTPAPAPAPGTGTGTGTGTGSGAPPSGGTSSNMTQAELEHLKGLRGFARISFLAAMRAKYGNVL